MISEISNELDLISGERDAELLSLHSCVAECRGLYPIKGDAQM